MTAAGSVFAFNGVMPKIHSSVFLAPGSVVIGDVEIGADCSVWYNTVIRGDINQVRIGPNCNIQDGTVIHVDHQTYPTVIGADVLIGHAAIVHACTLADGAFVGMGAIIMDAAVIERDGMLAAGGMLTPGKRIGERQMWTGSPARFHRDLTDAEVAEHRAACGHYAGLARMHAQSLGQAPSQ